MMAEEERNVTEPRKTRRQRSRTSSGSKSEVDAGGDEKVSSALNEMYNHLLFMRRYRGGMKGLCSYYFQRLKNLLMIRNIVVGTVYYLFHSLDWLFSFGLISLVKIQLVKISYYCFAFLLLFIYYIYHLS